MFGVFILTQICSMAKKRMFLKVFFEKISPQHYRKIYRASCSLWDKVKVKAAVC